MTKISAPPDVGIQHHAGQHEWGNWLRLHHENSPGVWLRIAKKGSGLTSVSYLEALETALCFGWIDGQKKKLDEHAWLQRFSPRRSRSIWSKANCTKAQALFEQGRMQPAGLKEMELAKEDGRWENAYDSASTMTMPHDLQQALDAEPGAAAFFATLDSANRYAVLWRVQTAKKAETRAKRIRQFVEMLARREKIHP
ncbi:MAG TPA: YdeI/OmpD-associated family protein [Oxalicibacterium sp.]|nr:YdeI/OmpD-associated family protein [Oxalicibacterium sp.]